jgi:hypothetical protein
MTFPNAGVQVLTVDSDEPDLLPADVGAITVDDDPGPGPESLVSTTDMIVSITEKRDNSDKSP